MARITKPLSEAEIKGKKATSKQLTLFDGQGLFLLVKPTGAKGWRFKFTFNGKSHMMSFGSYPAITLKQARKLREQAHEQLANGINPAAARQQEKQAEIERTAATFRVIAEDWHSRQTTLAESTRKLHRRRLDADIYPAIGEIPISDITPQMILNRVLRPMEARGVGVLTRRVKNIVSQVFGYAIALGSVERNPTVDLAGALTTTKRGNRAAIINPADLAVLLRAIDTYTGTAVVGAALRLAPMLFARPGELRAMKWCDISLATKEWRYLAPKTQKQHIVPLPTQAVEILESLHPLTGSGELAFPGTRSPHRPISENTLNSALRYLGFSKEHVTSHGFRATARTLLAEQLHERIDLIELQLGHAVRDSNGEAYNRATFLPERKALMQRWANFLDRLKAGGADVIHLRKAAR